MLSEYKYYTSDPDKGGQEISEVEYTAFKKKVVNDE